MTISKIPVREVALSCPRCGGVAEERTVKINAHSVMSKQMRHWIENDMKRSFKCLTCGEFWHENPS